MARRQTTDPIEEMRRRMGIGSDSSSEPSASDGGKGQTDPLEEMRRRMGIGAYGQDLGGSAKPTTHQSTTRPYPGTSQAAGSTRRRDKDTLRGKSLRDRSSGTEASGQVFPTESDGSLADLLRRGATAFDNAARSGGQTAGQVREDPDWVQELERQRQAQQRQQQTWAELQEAEGWVAALEEAKEGKGPRGVARDAGYNVTYNGKYYKVTDIDSALQLARAQASGMRRTVVEGTDNGAALMAERDRLLAQVQGRGLAADAFKREGETTEDHMADMADGDASIYARLHEIDAQLGLPTQVYGLGDRLASMLQGFGNRTGAAWANAAGMAMDLPAVMSAVGGIGYNYGGKEKIEQPAWMQQAQRQLYDMADRSKERADSYAVLARQDASALGKLAIDAGDAALDMAADAMANVIVPGSGLTMMGVRVFGSASQEARLEGKSSTQQFLKGVTSAAIEILTEKIGGPFEKVYGATALGKFTKELTGKIGSPAMQKALDVLLGALGEGAEEVLSDILNEVADRLDGLVEWDWSFFRDPSFWAQTAYDGLVGAVLGAAGSVVEAGGNEEVDREEVIEHAKQAAIAAVEQSAAKAGGTPATEKPSVTIEGLTAGSGQADAELRSLAMETVRAREAQREQAAVMEATTPSGPLTDPPAGGERGTDGYDSAKGTSQADVAPGQVFWEVQKWFGDQDRATDALSDDEYMALRDAHYEGDRATYADLVRKALKDRYSGRALDTVADRIADEAMARSDDWRLGLKISQQQSIGTAPSVGNAETSPEGGARGAGGHDQSADWSRHDSAAGAGMQAESGGIRRELEGAFRASSLDLYGQAAQILADGYTADLKAADYIAGVRDAYRLAASGMSLEQAREHAENAGALHPTQFEHAWSLGKETRSGRMATTSVSTGLTKTGEESTPPSSAEAAPLAGEARSPAPATGAEGRAQVQGEAMEKAAPERAAKQVTTALAMLGEQADAAAAAYDGKTDPETYAAAMYKAAGLYVAQGSDLDAAVRAARSGKRADIVGELTDAQIAAAKEIGGKLRAEIKATRKGLAEHFAALRKAADALRQNSRQVGELDEAIRDANKYGADIKEQFDREFDALEELAKADPAAKDTPAYKKARESADRLARQVQQMQELIRQYEQKRREIAADGTAGSEEGTYHLAEEAGKVGKFRYEAVELGKLSEQQRQVLDVSGKLAEALGLEMTVVSAQGDFGGAYMFNGVLYLNIDAGLGLRDFSKAIAAASFSHELTHFIQDYAPEEYGELKDLVAEHLGPEELERLTQQQLKWAPSLSYDEAVDEVVANACQTMLRDSEAAAKIAAEHKSLGEKIRDFFRDMVQKIRATFGQVDTKDAVPVYEAARALEEHFGEMQALWDKALEIAAASRRAELAVKGREKAAPKGGARYQKIGVREDGIEVYETSEETKRLPWKERRRRAISIMSDVYRGKTARFNRNGHIYYARFSSDDLRKNIYGDKKSDDAGRDAKINAGADGDFFDLVENSIYRNSLPESGKATHAHRGVSYWDYFVKTVQIDGRVFDLIANVRRKATGEYVYSLQLNENKNIEAASPDTRPKEGEIDGAPTTSMLSVPQSSAKSKPKLQTWGMAGEATQAWNGVETEAVQHFGVTDNVRTAGYLLQDGRMLDFSGAHWLEGRDPRYIAEWRRKNDIRQVDHEDVGEAFEELGEDAPDDPGLAFMQRGNIRLSPEAPGIELFAGKEPTPAQYAQIREFIRGTANRSFTVDLTGDGRKRAGSLRYDGTVRPARVVNDIRIWYQTGELRDTSRAGFYQTWSQEQTDDTPAEKRGREIARARLQSEQAVLAQTVQELTAVTKKQGVTIEQLRKQMKLTKTQEARTGDARKMARELLRGYSSQASVESVTEGIKSLGDYILQSREIDQQELRQRALEVAEEIVEYSQETLDDDGTGREIAKELRGRKLSIDESYLGDFASQGGYDSFRKGLFGRLTIAKRQSGSAEIREGYASVDQVYHDLQQSYGTAFFPEMTNEADQLMVLADLVRYEPITENLYSMYGQEVVEDLADRICMQLLDGALRPTAPTMADRQHARAEGLRQQILDLKREKALDEKEAGRLYHTVYDLSLALDKAQSRYRSLQASSDARLAQVRKEGRARALEIRAKERLKAVQKIDALRDRYQEMVRQARAQRDQKIDALKEHQKEKEKRERDRRAESAGVQKYRKAVTQTAAELMDMLATNTDKKHVPEVLKAPLGDFLAGLDFSSRSLLDKEVRTQADEKWHASFLRMLQALSGQREYFAEGTGEVDMGGYLDISEENMAFLRNTAKLIHTAMSEGTQYTVQDMSAEELRDLSSFLKNLKTAIRNMNSFLANARFESVREAAAADIAGMEALGKAKESAESKLSKGLLWKNGTPYYVFKRFGEGGKSIFDGFTRGWAQMASDAKEIIDFTAEAYTDREAREWKKQEHRFALESGEEIRITTCQIMELSQLLGREQALKHIQAGGIRIGDVKTKKGVRSDQTQYHLSEKDIQGLMGLLTPRQKSVAKALQGFMARRGAEWGNEVSMRRFGYQFYTEGEGYYPIKTDSTDRPMADTDARQNSMFRLLDLSSSKPPDPKASNTLVVGDIFDTFADHMSDMAKLHGMGLPILDAIKWFNYKERIDRPDGTYSTRTMQRTMEQAFGKGAGAWFRTLMKDINGVSETADRGADLLVKFMGSYKAAAVGANLRVMFLQPTSYVRAATVIEPKYLAAALAGRGLHKEALQYSGEAKWKSLGYFDTGIAKSMRGQIQHDSSIKDRLVELSMTGAEWGDRLTWGYLWKACKMQARAKNKSLTGEALMAATEELFREVIYSSQVMDSTLTRSELMRSKGGIDKVLTPFMAEPTLSANILMDAAYSYHLDERRYGKAEAWQRNGKKIGKALTVYICSAAASAFVESLIDAIRDDDDEEYGEKVLQAFFGQDIADLMLGKEGAKLSWRSLLDGNLFSDLSVLGKLPYTKDIISRLQGYQSSNIATGSLDTLFKVYDIWKETIQLANGILDKPTKITNYGNMTAWGKIYKTLQALSQISGLAVSNLTRDAVALWNTVMNGRKDEWKILTYENKARRAWREQVQATGLSAVEYQALRDEMDLNGSGSISQDEMGEVLLRAIAEGRVTEAQADAVWDSVSTGSKSFAAWQSERAGKERKADMDADGNKSVSQAEAAAWIEQEVAAGRLTAEDVEMVWSESVKTGKSYSQYRMERAMDSDGNGKVKQDEAGTWLLEQIQSGAMTEEQAAEAWDRIVTGKTTFEAWKAKHK